MAELLAHRPILEWYDANKRSLPWRPACAWGVLVSEVMLQQTPVSRVVPVYESWMARWPSPAALAMEPAGEAVREWGRLGYPRRALRLHEAACVIDRKHGGIVPSTYAELLTLPGVGDYTAAAVVSFAYDGRAVVLDTNVRRVLARLVGGVEYAGSSATAAERLAARELLPEDPGTAARWNIALMELGALVCGARSPRCERCPVADQCSWQHGGRPSHSGAPRRGQAYAGTDRQCRGRLLAMLREAEGDVPAATLDIAWADGVQRERALASLLDDGLVVRAGEGAFALP